MKVCFNSNVMFFAVIPYVPREFLFGCEVICAMNRSWCPNGILVFLVLCDYCLSQCWLMLGTFGSVFDQFWESWGPRGTRCCIFGILGQGFPQFGVPFFDTFLVKGAPWDHFGR